jgi:phosphoglycolate phosphatase
MIIRNLPKIVIFDWSGVISNDFFIVYETVMRVFKYYKIPRITLEKFKKEFSVPIIEFYRKYLPAKRFSDIDKIYKKKLELTRRPKMFPQADSILYKLLSRKHNLFLLSSHYRDSIIEEMKSYNIPPETFNGIFANVVDKPSRIKQVLSEIGAPKSDTIFIGDRVSDIQAAKTVSIKSIASTYGYTEKSILEKENPDYFIDSLYDLNVS